MMKTNIVWVLFAAFLLIEGNAKETKDATDQRCDKTIEAGQSGSTLSFRIIKNNLDCNVVIKTSVGSRIRLMIWPVDFVDATAASDQCVGEAHLEIFDGDAISFRQIGENIYPNDLREIKNITSTYNFITVRVRTYYSVEGCPLKPLRVGYKSFINHESSTSCNTDVLNCSSNGSSPRPDVTDENPTKPGGQNNNPTSWEVEKLIKILLITATLCIAVCIIVVACKIYYKKPQRLAATRRESEPERPSPPPAYIDLPHTLPLCNFGQPPAYDHSPPPYDETPPSYGSPPAYNHSLATDDNLSLACVHPIPVNNPSMTDDHLPPAYDYLSVVCK